MLLECYYKHLKSDSDTLTVKCKNKNEMRRYISFLLIKYRNFKHNEFKVIMTSWAITDAIYYASISAKFKLSLAV